MPSVLISSYRYKELINVTMYYSLLNLVIIIVHAKGNWTWICLRVKSWKTELKMKIWTGENLKSRWWGCSSEYNKA